MPGRRSYQNDNAKKLEKARAHLNNVVHIRFEFSKEYFHDRFLLKGTCPSISSCKVIVAYSMPPSSPCRPSFRQKEHKHLKIPLPAGPAKKICQQSAIGKFSAAV